MSINDYPTDPALDAELKRLNEAVEDAIKTRTYWMDAHMEDYSRLKVGETLYDIQKGVPLGVIRRLYRYWANRNPIHDTHMSIDAEYQVDYSPGNCYDNTSRQIGVSFGSREEADCLHGRLE